MAQFSPFPQTCQCVTVECPARLTGGTCTPAAVCVGTNAPCKPTTGGRGVPIPGAAFGAASTDPDPASAAETVAGALLITAALARYEHARTASLLLLLGVAALTGIVVAGGLATVPWWVWIAAAFAVLMQALGPNGAELLTNTTLASSLL